MINNNFTEEQRKKLSQSLIKRRTVNKNNGVNIHGGFDISNVFRDVKLKEVEEYNWVRPNEDYKFPYQQEHIAMVTSMHKTFSKMKKIGITGKQLESITIDYCAFQKSYYEFLIDTLGADFVNYLDTHDQIAAWMENAIDKLGGKVRVNNKTKSERIIKTDKKGNYIIKNANPFIYYPTNYNKKLSSNLTEDSRVNKLIDFSISEDKGLELKLRELNQSNNFELFCITGDKNIHEFLYDIGIQNKSTLELKDKLGIPKEGEPDYKIVEVFVDKKNPNNILGVSPFLYEK